MAASPASLEELRGQAAHSNRIFAADLLKATQGTLLEGTTARKLPPGRYRLHLSLSVAPWGHPSLAGLAVTVTARQEKRVLTFFDFPGCGEFLDLGLDFTQSASGYPPVSVVWSVGEEGKLNRVRAAGIPDDPAAAASRPEEKVGPEEDEGVDWDADAPERDDQGAMLVRDLPRIPLRLAVRLAAIETLPPVAVTRLQADKVVYRPGENGVLQLQIRNFGEAPASVLLHPCLVRELSDAEPLPGQKVALDPGKEQELEIPFTARGRWGVAAHVGLESGGRTETFEDPFLVTDNFFEVGIGYPGGSDLHTGLGKFHGVADDMRRQHSNLLEVFFWAPDDWALLVSPTPKWWSGQASYPEDEDNLKALIALCHQHGIGVAAYASSNAAGPFGWELARRKPHWFGKAASGGIGGWYHVEHLDVWNDEAWRKDHGHTDWYVVGGPDLRRIDTLDWGIGQIIESARHYGWDAVRFDGHYTTGNDEMSTRNVRRLKERVWSVLPDFRFGFNYGRAPEWAGRGAITHEMREAMAGGGLYLQEGITNWRYTNQAYENWYHYATNELRIAREIQRLGGSYHCIWSLNPKNPPAVNYYKLVYGLVAGGHSYYGSHIGMPGCPDWGSFMTRWSAALWDPALQPLKNPEQRFQIDSQQLQWKPFARERIESPERKFVVLHLVNPPPKDAIRETELPVPSGPVAVLYRPEPQTRIVRAVLVRPEARPFDVELTVRPEGEAVSVRLPGVQHWAVVLWEVQGRFEPPRPPPPFTDPPDAKRLAEAETAPVIESDDPNRAPVREASGPGTLVILCNSGSQNIGPCLTTDPDSGIGTVEFRPLDQAQARMGRSWVGPLQPGKYRVSFRLKWVDPTERPAPQQLEVAVRDENWEDLLGRAAFATPGHSEPPAGAMTLGPSGRYQDYPSVTFEKKRPGYIHISGETSTTRLGPHTLYLEKIRLDALELYTDDRLAEFETLPDKPEGLPAPSGQQPKRILFVRGMFWQFYIQTPALDAISVYSLPETFPDLYGFDAVILANMDLSNSTLADRRMLRDYVHDGGRLVLLGGCFTLGQGGVQRTWLEDLLPVQCQGPGEVVPCQPPLLLGSESGKPDPESPALFYRHLVRPKPSASVLAWAGEHPVAVAWQQGQGLVAVFAGTTLGEGDEKHRPFWETQAWPRLLRQLALSR
ncbi:MAG: hypothetical protein HYU36_01230 [Planctomycetes bacterium]|nr:hypothetical protein [Planctomycetota bacterium]